MQFPPLLEYYIKYCQEDFFSFYFEAVYLTFYAFDVFILPNVKNKKERQKAFAANLSSFFLFSLLFSPPLSRIIPVSCWIYWKYEGRGGRGDWYYSPIERNTLTVMRRNNFVKYVGCPLRFSAEKLENFSLSCSRCYSIFESSPTAEQNKKKRDKKNNVGNCWVPGSGRRLRQQLIRVATSSRA